MNHRSPGLERGAMRGNFSKLIQAVVRGETAVVSRLLANSPELATLHSSGGATRQDSSEWFFKEIAHYMYAGDTALLMAAAAFHRSAAESLI